MEKKHCLKSKIEEGVRLTLKRYWRTMRALEKDEVKPKQTLEEFLNEEMS